MFQHIEAFAGDHIVTLNEAFQKDPRPHKVNLSIGIYCDEEGRVPAQEAVHLAELRLATARQPKPYLPMEGAANFRHAVQALLFGEGHEALRSKRVTTIQTVGSSGGLKAGAEFIRQWFASSGVWLSDPSWDNHRSLFESAGIAVGTYPYYDPAGGVRFDAMLAALRALPHQSVVLLHACCHNPTGVDLTHAQWMELIPVIRERRLIPFLDLAYQGFGEGIEEDAFAVRLLAQAGIHFLVANTLSKSMGLYGERCGALSVVCGDAQQAERVLGQLRFTVRQNYFSPPAHGGQVVAHVLGDPVLRASWVRDLTAMRERIRALRVQLHAALSRKRARSEFGYLLTQRGMFSYTSLGAEQVRRLREEHAIYLVNSGRLCISGLNAGNVDRVAEAIVEVQ
jgi:aromatic-amino-acid transaminase